MIAQLLFINGDRFAYYHNGKKHFGVAKRPDKYAVFTRLLPNGIFNPMAYKIK